LILASCAVSMMKFGSILLIGAVEGSLVDYDAVRADILDVMTDPTWDDGSYAPIFIRLAWHSSATFNKIDGRGGTNGATMRFDPEASDPGNAGLEHARDRLELVKQNHPDISYSDLWVLASYVALEATNGPRIEFHGGRVDSTEGDATIAPGRLPDAERGLEPGLNVDENNRLHGWTKTAQHVRDVFGRLNFTDKETVALISGGHAYGRCHREFTGYEGAWMENSLYFSNEYVKDMIGDTWQAVAGDTRLSTGAFAPDDLRPLKSLRQYIDVSSIDPSLLGMRADDDLTPTANPDEFSPGRYRVTTTWINVRETDVSNSPVLVRLQENDELTIIALRHDDEGRTRGLAVHGGWVSIVTDGGSQYLERIGNLTMQDLAGQFRMIQPYHPAPIYAAPDVNTKRQGQIPAGSDFECDNVHLDANGTLFGQLSTGSWTVLYSSSLGLVSEKKVRNWNEIVHRPPQKDQYGHQMMLVTDMVLKWDETFRQHLDYYNTGNSTDDTDRLRTDFGKAFKKLTENGCSWTREVIV